MGTPGAHARRPTAEGQRRRAGRRRRSGAPLLVCSAAALAVLTLGTTGTLSSWTSAIIGNPNDTTATAKAVILQESNGSATCSSSDGGQTTVNSYSCTTINKYGGTASPLVPGGTAATDVTFSNIGGANATSFQLAPGTCTQSPTAGSGTPAAANLCANGDLTIAVSCSPGSTYSSGSAWSDLVYAAAAPPSATKTHTATGTELNTSASWTCRVTVTLIAAAQVTDQGITLSQPLTWTLNQ